MAYLYAVFGMAMLLPIMAGLQFSVELGQLEILSDANAMARWRDGNQRELSQELDYLADERQRLEAVLRLPSLSAFSCEPSTYLGVDATGSGFALDVNSASSSGCAFVTDRPFDLKRGVDRRARLVVDLAAPGSAQVVDSCLVIDGLQRCALEQERQT